MHGQPLFEKVVELCGVSSVLAPGLVRRSLTDGKVRVEDATAGDYKVALPRLLARLRAYMPEDEAQRRSRRIAGMLASIDLGRAVESEDESDWSLIGRVTDALRSGTPHDGSARPDTGRTARATDARPTPASGEIPLDQDDEPTLMGRRYTAHERQVLRDSGAISKDSALVRGDSAEIDLRKIKR